MSAELISAVSLAPLPIGMLADGTLYYAPIGEVVVTGPLVTCHLCGRSLRSVTAHLRVHGWTKMAYCEAFGLERGQSLEGPDTRKLRAAALTSRLVFEPAMREGSAAGRASQIWVTADTAVSLALAVGLHWYRILHLPGDVPARRSPNRL